MATTLLVPLDGSPLSEQAVPFASRLARATGGSLILLRAHSELDLSLYLQVDTAETVAAEARLARQQAEDDLASVAERVGKDGVSARAYVHSGKPVEVITDGAAAASADYIVMATHGRGGLGRWLLGSIADEVLRTAEVPLLLVAPSHRVTDDGGQPLRVLVPLDGSDLAATAIGPAVKLVESGRGWLHLLRVVEPPPWLSDGEGDVLAYPSDAELAAARAFLEDVAAPLRERGLQVVVDVAAGRPATAIAAVARDRSADLIALATHGRGGWARLVLGSVAQDLLHHAGLPLLIVPPFAHHRETELREVDLTIDTEPPVNVTVDQRELALLDRGLGELLYKPGRDVRLAEPIRQLQAKLRGARNS